jgi:hypothetical protein
VLASTPSAVVVVPRTTSGFEDMEMALAGSMGEPVGEPLGQSLDQTLDETVEAAEVSTTDSPVRSLEPEDLGLTFDDESEGEPIPRIHSRRISSPAPEPEPEPVSEPIHHHEAAFLERVLDVSGGWSELASLPGDRRSAFVTSVVSRFLRSDMFTAMIEFIKNAHGFASLCY